MRKIDNVIEINGLCKEFKEFELKGISFSIPKGYIMGLVGQNGAGKTTIIRSILNMTKRKSGEIKVFGMDNILCEKEIKQDLAVVLDDAYFAEHFTLKEIEKSIKGFYKKWDSKIYKKYLKEFNLSENKRLKELSRGMRVKLMIAVALSHNAKLLILDEPTSGLDPVARDELLDIFKDYIADGEHSILFSTHITSDLEKIADFITIIVKGKIFYSGIKDDLMEKYCLVKGGINDITETITSNTIGLNLYRNGFNGMFPTSEVKSLSKDIFTEPISIDEILVCLSKGARHE